MRHTSDPELDEQLRLFGECVRLERRRAGLTQVDLAAAADLDRAAIGFLERAERAPELLTLLRVARALGLEPSELLRDVDSPGVDRHAVDSRDLHAHGEQSWGGVKVASKTSQKADGTPLDHALQFGATLRIARTAAGFSQQALALRADVDRAAISVYERGARAPNLRTILKLARALERSPVDLLLDIEQRT